MSTREDVEKVKRNIVSEYRHKEALVYALSLEYAGRAINIFRERQANEEYWVNRTHDAESRMFSDAFIDKNEIGWFLAHGVSYGVYLELANNRQNEAIRPIVNELAPQFFKEVRSLW